MNIQHLNQQHRVSQGMIASPATRRRPEKPQTASVSGDNVQMSALARMISQQSEALLELHRPRPEMVAKFRQQSLPDTIPDSAVDTIFQRLADS
jgi:hypothetical protein